MSTHQHHHHHTSPPPTAEDPFGWHLKLWSVLTSVNDNLGRIATALEQPNVSINSKLDLLLSQGAKLMAGIDDAIAAISHLQDEVGLVSASLAKLAGELAGAGADPEKIAAVVSGIENAVAALEAARSAADPPVPPPVG